MQDAVSTLLKSKRTEDLMYHFQQYKPVSQDNRYESHCVNVLKTHTAFLQDLVLVALYLSLLGVQTSVDGTTLTQVNLNLKQMTQGMYIRKVRRIRLRKGLNTYPSYSILEDITRAVKSLEETSWVKDIESTV
jgi:hypothetical protein